MKPISLLLFLAIMFSSCQKDKIIFVADHYASANLKSLLIKENKNDDWTSFNDQIEGFNYEEGYSYQLKVSISKDKSGLKYKLKEVISKSKTEETTTNFHTLNEEKWFVSQIEGVPNKIIKKIYFNIKGEKIGGFSGCNTFRGTFKSKGNSFKVSTINATKMFCEDTAKLENMFQNALHNALSYTIENNVLKVYGINNKLLITASQNNESTELVKKWFITNISGFANKTGKTAFFTINNNQIKGNGGCNTFVGEIESNKLGVLKIKKLIASQMFCHEFASLESATQTALSKVAFYKIIDSTLLLLDKSKHVLLSATSDVSKLVDHTQSHQPYSIEYNIFSRGLAFKTRIDEIKNSLFSLNLKPQKTGEKKQTLSKADIKFFRDQLEKIEKKSLEKIQAPSKKHQFDGAPSAQFIVTYNGKKYHIPTFDHGNPPKELKAMIERIMELRLK